MIKGIKKEKKNNLEEEFLNFIKFNYIEHPRMNEQVIDFKI
jgi:hypothetical protein